MSLIEAEDALGSVLEGAKVRRKPNRTGRLRQAKRVVNGSPEVMVKITGFGKGADHINAHLRYVTRNAKLELETDRGDVVRGKEAVKDVLTNWTEDIRHSPRHRNQRDTVHIVLSMPEGTPATAVHSAARAYAKRVFSANHEYVFALHTDEPHPHVHLTVKMLGFDGKRLNPRKADLQGWREKFARELRDQGVNAEATSRAARGVVRKAENSIVRHIERGDNNRPPRVSRVNAERNKELVEELIAESNGQSPAEKPWESAIKQRQQFVRGAWLSAADALEKNAIPRKEHSNARPDYDKLDPACVRAGQRAAAVYQSNLEELGLRVSAVALARMRDVSRIDVVQQRRPAQVLLYAHASNRLGRYGSANYELRRPRTRALTLTTGDGRSRGGRDQMTDTRSADQTLPSTIRQFVQAMPAIDTQMHTLKRRLVNQFRQQAKIDRSQGEGEAILEPVRSDRKTFDR